MKWILPMVTLLVVDLALNVFYYAVPAVSAYTLIKVAAYAGIIWVGSKMKASDSWWKLLGGGVLGALLFYFVTNTASWIFDPGYMKTLNGWWQALTTGLPGYPPTWMFLKNTLLSGGLFTGLFAGVMKVSEALEEAEEKEPAEESGEEPVPEEA
jgi:hypothetical protein